MGDFGGGAVEGSAGEKVGHELGDAGLFFGFGEESATEDEGDMDKGEAVVFADDERSAVFEFEAMDGEVEGGRGGGGFGSGGRRGEEGEGAIGFAEVGAGDALEVGGGNVAQLLEVSFGEAGVAGVVFAGAEAGGATAHGLEAGELVDELVAAGFFDFLVGEIGFVEGGDFLDEEGDEFVFALGIEDGMDAEESGVLGVMGPGADAVDKVEVVAEALVKAGAAALAEDVGEDVEGGYVGMAEGDGMVGHVEAGDLVGAGGPGEAGGLLGRFGGEDDGRTFAAGEVGVGVAEEGFDVVGVDVADDDGDHVVGGVVAVDEVEEVVAVDGAEDVFVANDGMAVGVDAEGGFPEEFAVDAGRAVVAHGEFAEDDVDFAFPFVFGEGGVHDGVGEDVESDVPVVGGEVAVEDGAVVGGVGVDASAGVVDGSGDFPGAAGGGAFEDHVFEVVGHAGAEVVAFMNGADADPDLDGDDGGAAVLFDEEDHAVVEDDAAEIVVGLAEEVEGGRLGRHRAGGEHKEEGESGEGNQAREGTEAPAVRERAGGAARVGRKGLRKASMKL